MLAAPTAYRRPAALKLLADDTTAPVSATILALESNCDNPLNTGEISAYRTPEADTAESDDIAGAMLVVLATMTLTTLSLSKTADASYIAPPAVLENGAWDSAETPNILWP